MNALLSSILKIYLMTFANCLLSLTIDSSVAFPFKNLDSSGFLMSVDFPDSEGVVKGIQGNIVWYMIRFEIVSLAGH